MSTLVQNSDKVNSFLVPLQKTKKDSKGKKRRNKEGEEEQPVTAAMATGSELMGLDIEAPKEVERSLILQIILIHCCVIRVYMCVFSAFIAQ